VLSPEGSWLPPITIPAHTGVTVAGGFPPLSSPPPEPVPASQHDVSLGSQHDPLCLVPSRERRRGCAPLRQRRSPLRNTISHAGPRALSKALPRERTSCRPGRGMARASPHPSVANCTGVTVHRQIQSPLRDTSSHAGPRALTRLCSIHHPVPRRDSPWRTREFSLRDFGNTPPVHSDGPAKESLGRVCSRERGPSPAKARAPAHRARPRTDQYDPSARR